MAESNPTCPICFYIDGEDTLGCDVEGMEQGRYKTFIQIELLNTQKAVGQYDKRS